MDKKQSKFIEEQSIPDSDYLGFFGGSVNRKITWARLKAIILDFLAINFLIGSPSTVAALKLMSLPVNASVRTKGCLFAGDGGSGDFLISEAPTSTVDGYSCFEIANGNYANLRSELNVIQFGVLGDGSDSTEGQQLAFNRASGKVLRYPDGLFVVSRSILIDSNTTVYGSGAATRILANQSAFVGVNNPPYDAPGAEFTVPLFRNRNFHSATIEDENITIKDMSFDYNNLSVPPMGGTHCISMRRARNIKVLNCFFYRNEDAVAFLGCEDTLIDGCYAFDSYNCSYDHWDSPKRATLVNSFAILSVESAQIVNFNPEATLEFDTGRVADGFTMSNCHFFTTFPTGGVLQLEPLTEGNTAQNIGIDNCTFNNISIAARRDTRSASITNSKFNFLPTNINTGVSSSPLDGGVAPSEIKVTGNDFIGSNTPAGAYATLLIWANGYTVTGNTVKGGDYYAALDTSTYVGKVFGNNFALPASGVGPIVGTGGFPQWIPITTFLNGWSAIVVSYPSVAYYVDDYGVAHLRGAVQGGTLGLAAFVMPNGAKALNIVRGPVLSNGGFGSFRVDDGGAGGGVVPVLGSNVNFVLDGISFRVQ